MIIHLKADTPEDKIAVLAAEIGAKFFSRNGIPVLITGSGMKEVPDEVKPFLDESWVLDSDIQLASRKYQNLTREISLGDMTIGSGSDTIMMVGPCSVESQEQIDEVAAYTKSKGLKILRGGAFKPRTSPYSFQGLGLEGLEMMREAADKNGLLVISEVRDATHVDQVIELADIVQIGAKSMYDHGILKACGRSNKPALIKRGFGTTLQEFVQCAEFIMSGGNENVILCERGIRTFETKTRFTLDLCGVSWLKEYTNLPVVLDPSHAMGHRYGVPDLARACVAMGIDGLMIEAHSDPSVAKSDAAQQLDLNQLDNLLETLGPVAAAVGRTIR